MIRDAEGRAGRALSSNPGRVCGEEMPSSKTPSLAGIPPGLVDALMQVLARQGGPLRRRKLLEALEQRGHRVSLAGLNRALQYCQESGLTVDGPDGVRAAPNRGSPS